MKNKCKLCKSKMRNSLCSNYNCKFWKNWKNMASKMPKIILGDNSTNPIPLRCAVCHYECDGSMCGKQIYCRNCKKFMLYNYIPNKWYKGYGNILNTTIKFIDDNIGWDESTKITENTYEV